METIHFQISKEDKQYVAEGIEAAIVTQASTLDGLMQQIHEAVELHFDDEQDILPVILVEMNLTELVHA